MHLIHLLGSAHEKSDVLLWPYLLILIMNFLPIHLAKNRLLGYILTLIACHLFNIKSFLYLFLFMVLIIICSSYLSFHEQLCSIRLLLQQNRFFIYLINQMIRNFLDRQCNNKDKSQNVPSFPYLFFFNT